MILRKLRLQHGYTQSQLSEMAGVTVRTIQRIEQGNSMGLETAKALAAVFEVDFQLFLTEKTDMNDDTHLKLDEQQAIILAKRTKAFYESLITFVIMAAIFIFAMGDEPLVWWLFGGIGIGVIVQGLIAFEVFTFFSPGWEKRFIEKRLGRRL